MFKFFGTLFSGIALAVSSLFGSHTEPIATSTVQAVATSSFGGVTSIPALVKPPVKTANVPHSLPTPIVPPAPEVMPATPAQAPVTPPVVQKPVTYSQQVPVKTGDDPNAVPEIIPKTPSDQVKDSSSEAACTNALSLLNQEMDDLQVSYNTQYADIQAQPIPLQDQQGRESALGATYSSQRTTLQAEDSTETINCQEKGF